MTEEDIKILNEMPPFYKQFGDEQNLQYFVNLEKRVRLLEETICLMERNRAAVEYQRFQG